MTAKCQSMCRGCRDDFYNGQNNLGVQECWSFRTAKVERRFRIGWWTQPTQPGAFTEVETLSCHHAPGQYAHYKELPSFAADPRRLPKKRRAKVMRT